MPEVFIAEVKEVIHAFPWIERVDSEAVGRVARLRLWIDENFVDIYHNTQTGSTSYAYIVQGDRLFGANNMRIGWHIHSFGNPEVHRKSKPISIKEFLSELERELKNRGEI
ncbi:MAG: hypothetical protein ACE5JP_01460 [Candidatus Bipolaricaulia bacterium]